MLGLFRAAFPKNPGGILSRAAQILRQDSVLDGLGLTPGEVFDQIKGQLPIEEIQKSLEKPNIQQETQGTRVPGTRVTAGPVSTGTQLGTGGTEVYQIFIGNEKIEEILKSQFTRVSPKSSGGTQ